VIFFFLPFPQNLDRNEALRSSIEMLQLIVVIENIPSRTLLAALLAGE